MANVCFFETEIVIGPLSQLWIEQNYEIWFADRYGHSEDSDVTKSEI